MTGIQIEHVSFAYEKAHMVLDDINIEAKGSESIGLLGANGVGKSTLLKMLVGLNLDFQGRILVDGIPVEKKTLPEVRQKIGYVFQDSDSQLFLSTAYEDIAFGPRNYGVPEEEVEKRVSRALELTGISHLKDRQTYKMSGGEKKLVSIATILSMEPEIILMDLQKRTLKPSLAN